MQAATAILTLTVNVSTSAATPLVNTAVISGGNETNTSNDTATDSTIVVKLQDLTVTKSHTGNFTQGQNGAQYTITPSNIGGVNTNATITVTDTLPTRFRPMCRAQGQTGAAVQPERCLPAHRAQR